MNNPGRSELEILRHFKQVNFFNQCYKKYQQARDVSGEYDHYFTIGDTKVCLSFAGEKMVPLICPALEHLRCATTNNPDVTICIWDTDSTSVEMVPPPCTVASFTDRGDIWGFNSSRIKTAFHWIENSVNIMDLQSKIGIFWVKNAESLPFWVNASPLRTLFHWWMENNGCQLLHAAAVGTVDGAVLITGKGGVGKSTTALACLNNGFYYLADDYVIVRNNPKPEVYSLYSSGKLNSEDIVKFKHLKQFISNQDNLDNEKAVLFLYPELKDQIIQKLPLKAIFLPSITKQKHTSIASEEFWVIQSAMSFTTMSQLPNVGLHTHKYISQLTNSLPGFLLELGSDINGIPTAISKFLSNQDEYKTAGRLKTNQVDQVNSKPLISIIIPVYNGERFLKEAISNILSQKYSAIEIIIVDDGSVDGTKNIISELPVDIRYFHQKNNGPASARNRGIKDVSGELIAFLDVDDLWPENTLNLLVNELMNDKELKIIRGNAQVMEEDTQTGKFEFTGDSKSAFPNYIGACLYRKSAFDEVGLFDPTLRFGEDNDWFNRAKELNIRMKRIEDVTLYVRRHGHNMTEGKNIVELNKLRVFKKSLDRMRAK